LCALTSIEHSGAPAEVKVRARQDIDAWMRS
jgi:hypothetical protein